MPALADSADAIQEKAKEFVEKINMGGATQEEIEQRD